jgi:hypothetical protein
MKSAQSADKKKTKKNPGFVSAQQLFENYAIEDKGGYITQEFQDFGYRLAVELDDLKHKSLYIKLAKTESRAILERALSFVSDAPSVKSKAKLFMWKLQQLRAEKRQK